MDYIDAAAFLLVLPTRDRLMFYSVFGGVPWLLESIDGQLSAEEDIIRLFVEAMPGMSLKSNVRQSLMHLRSSMRYGMGRSTSLTYFPI